MSKRRTIDTTMKNRMFDELRRRTVDWRVVQEGSSIQRLHVGVLTKDVVLFHPSLPRLFSSQSDLAAQLLLSAHKVVQNPHRAVDKLFRYTSLFSGQQVSIPIKDLETLRRANARSHHDGRLGKYDSDAFAVCRELGLIERWGEHKRTIKQAALTQEGESAIFLWHWLDRM